jgi:hypothetical protein
MGHRSLGLSGDRSSGSCVGPARAPPGATNTHRRDEFIAPGAMFADPAVAPKMNERLPHPGGRAYLANHVRR